MKQKFLNNIIEMNIKTGTILNIEKGGKVPIPYSRSCAEQWLEPQINLYSYRHFG